MPRTLSSRQSPRQIGLCALALCLGTGSAFACPQYDAAVTAVEADDAVQVAALYDDISVAPDCDDALREWLGDYLARDSFLQAMQDERVA